MRKKGALARVPLEVVSVPLPHTFLSRSRCWLYLRSRWIWNKGEFFLFFYFYCILALPIIQLIFHLICSFISQLEFLLLMEKHHRRKRIGLLIKITLDHVFPHDHRIRIYVTWCHPCSLYFAYLFIHVVYFFLFISSIYCFLSFISATYNQ